MSRRYGPQGRNVLGYRAPALHDPNCTQLCCKTPLDGESLPESKAAFDREMDRIYGPRKPTVIPAEPMWSPYR